LLIIATAFSAALGDFCMPLAMVNGRDLADRPKEDLHRESDLDVVVSNDGRRWRWARHNLRKRTRCAETIR
jgi:hypothetical protein